MSSALERLVNCVLEIKRQSTDVMDEPKLYGFSAGRFVQPNLSTRVSLSNLSIDMEVRPVSSNMPERVVRSLEVIPVDCAA
jgi:hypothetical protein